MKKAEKSPMKTIVFLILFCITLQAAEKLKQIQSNNIIDIRILQETPNEIVLEVNYFYSGNFGENVFLGAKMANNGKPNNYSEDEQRRILRGRQKTQIVLGISSGAPEKFTTNQIFMFMKIERSYSFLQEFFPYFKTWYQIKDDPIIKKYDIINLGPKRDVPNLIVTSVHLSSRRISQKGNFSIEYNLEATGKLDQLFKMRVSMGIFIRKGSRGKWMKKWDLTEAFLDQLGKGKMIREKLEFEIPDWGIGEYYISIHADVGNFIRESNEDDNTTERVIWVYR